MEKYNYKELKEWKSKLESDISRNITTLVSEFIIETKFDVTSIEISFDGIILSNFGKIITTNVKIKDEENYKDV